jgi:hypothetical protein
MSKLILLVVGAAWMAVLLPPFLRQRLDGGSSSSVSDFRRQLHTLQRTQAPRTQAPMRAMARPLAPSSRGAAPMRAPQGRGQHRMHEPRIAERPRLLPSDIEADMEPRHRRAHHGSDVTRSHYAPEEAFLSSREVIRRRRVNALYGLLAANGLTLFLAFSTGSTPMVWLFALAFLGLGAYCYVLVQLRNQEYMRRYYAQRRAA